MVLLPKTTIFTSIPFMMDFLNCLYDYPGFSLIALALLAFLAGFVDAIVGGGGLIQLPALLISLPQNPLPSLFGTNKMAAFAGTCLSALRYARRIKFNYPLLLLMAVCAGLASFLGAKMLSYIPANSLKPMVLAALVLMAIYTFFKKDLGSGPSKNLSQKQQLCYGGAISLVIGFYDGFFGPGAGSFFILAFVVILGFEFVQASAYAKCINAITNISALLVFVRDGHYILPLALLMALCNIGGSLVGTGLALKKGNGFVRLVFLAVVSLMILRYAYAIFWEK
jgi:uncharacterized protein